LSGFLGLKQLMFSKEIVKEAENLKGVERVFIGKVLSIYFPEIFINIFGHQDLFLEKYIVIINQKLME